MRATSVFGVLIALAGTHQLTFAGECNNAPFDRCGGKGWEGSECCTEGYECKVQNTYYSQCVPVDQSKSSCAKAYSQCGGKAFTGETCCVSGFECVKANAWYSQCLPKHRWESSAGGKETPVATTTVEQKPVETTTTSTEVQKPSTTTTVEEPKSTTTKEPEQSKTTEPEKPKTTTTTQKPVTTTTKPSAPKTTTTSSSGGSSTYAPISGGSSGAGSTTRYWDCCKASCSWPGKADVSSPVNTCKADGVTRLTDNNAQSGCNGGNAYMCNDNQPWAVNDKLSYGFAAASIAGKNEAGWCCGCYELTFTSGAVEGKKLVVQVTNTGGDLGSNHFDLQIPGGGVGIFNGCESQWNAPSNGWGERYGGLSSVSGCSDLPKELQAGCEWRFNWFKNADNPSVSFKEVSCPAELVKKTGCSRS
ncbi:RlpA-like double-psi beta-barrel-protein domain-containing protein-containing protein [Circinella umbellata]|nr:RlpA-like double-psi beta-barrel-protein domain-containing protein-containing protein [Circinella umbellata]